MPIATLLGPKDDEHRATAHIDFRSNKPVCDQADSIIHQTMGLLLCDWWENGGEGSHYGRINVVGQAMKFDARHYLARDMTKKGYGSPFLVLKYVLNGASWLTIDAKLRAREIGRAWHAWNNDPRPAVVSERITLTNGEVKGVNLDLRPFINTILREMEKRRKREREAAAKEAPGEA